LLSTLHLATMLPTWRCPHLLFMLPPNAVWITNKIGSIAWPGRLHVHVLSESMTGASSVWNAMLGLWNQVKAEPGWESAALLPPGSTGFPIRLGEPGPAVPPSGATWEAAEASSGPGREPTAAIDPGRARLALAGMAAIEGLLGCAVVDASTGLALARQTLGDPALDMDRAAAACTQVLRAHRQAARSMGLAEQLDELMSTAGTRQQIVRSVSRHPDLFLMVVLDRQRSNLALARFQLMEVDRGLA
jgi:predicted regulator of Ras-like GTPase activity (Roadblock/LC7/MglB family)